MSNVVQAKSETHSKAMLISNTVYYMRFYVLADMSTKIYFSAGDPLIPPPKQCTPGKCRLYIHPSLTPSSPNRVEPYSRSVTNAIQLDIHCLSEVFHRTTP